MLTFGNPPPKINRHCEVARHIFVFLKDTLILVLEDYPESERAEDRARQLRCAVGSKRFELLGTWLEANQFVVDNPVAEVIIHRISLVTVVRGHVSSV